MLLFQFNFPFYLISLPTLGANEHYFEMFSLFNEGNMESFVIATVIADMEFLFNLLLYYFHAITSAFLPESSIFYASAIKPKVPYKVILMKKEVF